VLALCALATVIAACEPAEPAKPKPVYGSITAYNHTGDYIHQFYINGTWGGNSFAYGGGGGGVCCIGYPAQWHEGLSATVRWTTSSSDPTDKSEDAATEYWHEKVVPIERYTEDDLGDLRVHFLPDGEVRLIVSVMGARHPDYPGPAYPVAPPGWPPWEKSKTDEPDPGTSTTKHQGAHQ
jgi:hypothetical protein